VAEPLISPTGVTVCHGEIIVAQEFLGIGAEAQTAAGIVASMPPPPAEEGGGEISPPNTGDGGLADSGASTTTLLLAAGITGIALLTARKVAAQRR
jgi:hypothetical protein